MQQLIKAKSFKVDEILEHDKLQNQDEILKYAYESQRGNQLLLITFFTLKKMEEKGFMEELEKNYGIFLEVDKFVDDLKNKLNEIKSFKALYEYIGTEFGKDKTELELIIEGYRRAKKMRYIRYLNHGDYNRRRGRSGVRGRGRGLVLRGRGRGLVLRGRGRGRRGLMQDNLKDGFKVDILIIS